MSETRVHLSKTEPAAYKALDEFSRTVGEICRTNGIDDRLKEIVMIHCSQLNGCSYCTRVHVDRAVAAVESAGEKAYVIGSAQTGAHSAELV